MKYKKQLGAGAGDVQGGGGAVLLEVCNGHQGKVAKDSTVSTATVNLTVLQRFNTTSRVDST